MYMYMYSTCMYVIYNFKKILEACMHACMHVQCTPIIIICVIHTTVYTVGGSWWPHITNSVFVHSGLNSLCLSPGQSLVLCSWVNHFTLTVPLFTYMYMYSVHVHLGVNGSTSFPGSLIHRPQRASGVGR